MKESSCRLLQMFSIIPRFQISKAVMNTLERSFVITDTVFLSDSLWYSEGGGAVDHYAESRYSV
jgi:hypothetical protein